MKRLSKFFIAALLLAVTPVSWSACNDLICGKWNVLVPGFNHVVQIVASNRSGWDFEKRVVDPGRMRNYGFKVGMVTLRLRKVSENQYVGETMWRNPLGLLAGWIPYELRVESENYLMGRGFPPSGQANVAGTMRAHVRIGSAPKQVTKQPKEKIEGGSGTGFFVSSDGLIVTNHHVIEGGNRVSVRVPSGQTFTAKVVTKSASTDLALLRIPYQTKNYLTFENPGAVEIGDDVFTLGFPVSDLLGKDVKYTDGSISSLSGIQGDATFLQISVPIQPGNSGGPLINERGNVVGIVTSTAAVEAFYNATGSLPQNINWAVKGVYASLLMPPGVKRGARSTTNPITNAKWSVVFIETK